MYLNCVQISQCIEFSLFLFTMLNVVNWKQHFVV